MIQIIGVVVFIILVVNCGYCIYTRLFWKRVNIADFLVCLNDINYYRNYVLKRTDLSPECKLHKLRIEIVSRCKFARECKNVGDHMLCFFDYYFEDELTEIPPEK